MTRLLSDSLLFVGVLGLMELLSDVLGAIQ